MKHTEIIFVIDKSGSMAHLVGDTIGGFNGFIESQKAIEGKATLTTVLFDTTYKTLHNGVDLHKVKVMTNSDYNAYGGTAMLDAIGDTINQVQDRHDELGAEKPSITFFDEVASRIPQFKKEETLVVGDSLSSDIAGGINAGIDTCWFNPSGAQTPSHMAITYTVKSLEDLPPLILGV